MLSIILIAIVPGSGAASRISGTGLTGANQKVRLLIMAKKTVEQLKAAADAAEKRAKELRAQAKKLTQAEEAKLSAEIIKAVEEWRKSYPQEMRREDLPAKFREWAQKNREKYKDGGQ